MDISDPPARSSSDLLELEARVGSGSDSVVESLLITKSAKKRKAADQQGKRITRIDSSAILSRAKAFLDKVKDQDSVIDSKSIEVDSEEEEESDRDNDSDNGAPAAANKPAQVELNLLLVPQPDNIGTGNNLVRLQNLLLHEEGDDSDSDESEDDSGEDYGEEDSEDDSEAEDSEPGTDTSESEH